MRPGPYEAVDVVAVAEAMHDAAGLVLRGVSGSLQAYEDWQYDMAQLNAETRGDY